MRRSTPSPCTPPRRADLVTRAGDWYSCDNRRFESAKARPQMAMTPSCPPMGWIVRACSAGWIDHGDPAYDPPGRPRPDSASPSCWPSGPPAGPTWRSSGSSWKPPTTTQPGSPNGLLRGWPCQVRPLPNWPTRPLRGRGLGGASSKRLESSWRRAARLVLVLDDLHRLSNPRLVADLGGLSESLAPQVHLVLSTRIDPPLAWSHYRRHRNLTEIRQSDLAFGHAESAELMERIMGRPIGADSVMALLVERRDGRLGFNSPA